MHSRAPDTTPQQEQRTRRAGITQRVKRAQRVALVVVTRLRTRRTLVATAALVLLLLLALLALCHARLLSQQPTPDTDKQKTWNTNNVSASKRLKVTASLSKHWLLWPDTQHGGSVRVMLLMVSTRVGAQLCYALASAYFADLPVVVVGYGTRPYVNAMKPSLYLDAMQRAGLRDRDVVLLLDSDILFSGEDMLPFIDDYIARSPAAPSALDVRAVRAGAARAPSLYAAQMFCYAPQTYGYDPFECMKKTSDNTVAAYVARTGVTYDLHDASVQPLRYLNSGVSIHRVWSARELLRAYVHYIATHTPRNDKSKQWHDDQSVFALFYNDLRAWEVEDDVLRNSSNTATAATQRGPHGLRAGQLQLEQTGRMSMVTFEYMSMGQVTDELWRASLDDAPHMQHFVVEQLPSFVDDVWRRYGGSVRLQQRTLTRAGNVTHTIDVTPPLLGLYTTQSETNSARVARIFPLIHHYASDRKELFRDNIMQLLPWYVPMQYNVTKWRQGRAHLLPSLVVLRTTNATKRVRYGDVCQQHNPFT